MIEQETSVAVPSRSFRAVHPGSGNGPRAAVVARDVYSLVKLFTEKGLTGMSAAAAARGGGPRRAGGADASGRVFRQRRSPRATALLV